MKLTNWKKARASVLIVSLLYLAACGSSSNVNSSLSSGGGGTGITSTVSSPAEMSVGDIMSVDFGGSTNVSIDFSGVSSSAGFILAVGSSNTSGTGTSMELSTDLSSAGKDLVAKAVAVDIGESFADENAFGPEEILSAWLRASEQELHSSENALVSRSNSVGSKSMSLKAASVGSTKTFKVLNSLSSVSSFASVTGEVRCVGENVVFYVDTSVPDSILSDSDINTLCDEFDNVAGAEEVLLGSISDVDGDGKLHILMTKQINLLGAMGGGIITGYFYAGDLYAESSSNSISNNQEIIYTMVPDPDGIYGTTISKEFAMSNLLPAVLPHELQHAISYNQHVFVNDGAAEENWLNEGMSHLTEDVMGYGMENPSRYAMYLASPSSYGVVTYGSPNLMERGASYLFLRFLYEQASDPSAFLRAMENTSKQGVDNLETAFNGPEGFSHFSEFLGRWVVALAMTDRGISQDSRYVYQPRVLNSSTGNLEGACISCDAQDNRGTLLEGVNLNSYSSYHYVSIDASTAIFYDLSSFPVTLKLAGTDGGGNFGTLIRYQ